jgi:5-hydroxyisourate hydrolase
MNGRLTFHAIDTWHGATVGTLDVAVRRHDGAAWRPVTRFATVANGRADGAVLEGASFLPGRYELELDVAGYFAATGVALPQPPFLTRVPLRFGVADAGERYHIAVLFGPWSYAYYRGS